MAFMLAHWQWYSRCVQTLSLLNNCLSLSCVSVRAVRRWKIWQFVCYFVEMWKITAILICLCAKYVTIQLLSLKVINIIYFIKAPWLASPYSSCMHFASTTCTPEPRKSHPTSGCPFHIFTILHCDYYAFSGKRTHKYTEKH